jgi:hypothetical protein
VRAEASWRHTSELSVVRCGMGDLPAVLSSVALAKEEALGRRLGLAHVWRLLRTTGRMPVPLSANSQSCRPISTTPNTRKGTVRRKHQHPLSPLSTKQGSPDAGSRESISCGSCLSWWSSFA